MQSTQATKTIILRFPNHKILWSFAKTHISSNLGINTIDMTLTCICCDADIALAIKDFQAIVVETINPDNYKND